MQPAQQVQRARTASALKAHPDRRALMAMTETQDHLGRKAQPALPARKVRVDPLGHQALMETMAIPVLLGHLARTEQQVRWVQRVPLVRKAQLGQQVLQALTVRMESQVHQVLLEQLVRQAHLVQSERSLSRSTSPRPAQT